MTFLLRRNGQIQTQSTGSRNSLEAWAVQDKWSLQFAFPFTLKTLLFIHVPALGRSQALRLSQTILFCPLSQSSEGPWVHCTAGESPWSRQGESEVGTASSTARAGLALCGGRRRQSCCSEGLCQSCCSEGLCHPCCSARDCRRAESFSLQLALLLNIAIFSCHALPVLLVVQSGQKVFRTFPHIIFICLHSGFYSI